MSSETLHSFLSRLSSAKRIGGQWLAQCPAHDDRTASLAVREGDEGRILVHCHAGCSTTAILTALGLDEMALFADDGPRSKATIRETYPYQDEQGRLLYETVRLDPKDFRQRRPDGVGGWIWNLQDVRRVCYRLPDLLEKAAILVVEGEKDADAALAIGVPATTNVGGAGKWSADYTTQLVQAHVQRVALLPDNDPPGRSHAHQVALSLSGAGIDVRIVGLPDLPDKGDLSDYLATHTKADLLALVRQTPRWTPDETRPPPPVSIVQDFQRTAEGRYTWAMVPPGIQFELDRVRRDHHELYGELTVKCDLAGVTRTQGGAVLTGEFNLSSVRARQERAKVLAQRAKTGEAVDWMAALEEFCERVFEAERVGTPAIRLDESVLAVADHTDIRVEGLALLCQHPVILFGDGGTAKSYLALYLAGRLAQRGVRVLYADWELLSDEHRDRLERLFGANKPALWYVSCDRPLVAEQERLLKIIRSEKIAYLIVDSVAVACDGPPEAAEITTSYFRAIRSFGVGSLHLAHTNRSEQADKKPFGSTFWHNLARSTWYCRRAEEGPTDRVTVGLFNRKANLGPLLPATAFTFQFDPQQTKVLPHGIEDIPDLASELPLWQRMRTILLKDGPMTTVSLAAELGAKENTINQTVKRRRRLFDRALGADGIQRIRLVQS